MEKSGKKKPEAPAEGNPDTRRQIIFLLDEIREQRDPAAYRTVQLPRLQKLVSRFKKD